MAYTVNMSAAAHRHLIAAEKLSSTDRRDVAGYLYGIAAECALKAMMLKAGIKVPKNAARRDNPFFAHFPELRIQLRDLIGNRRGTPLVNYVLDNSFLLHWGTKMRYSDGKQIQPRWITNWANNARQAVSTIDS